MSDRRGKIVHLLTRITDAKLSGGELICKDLRYCPTKALAMTGLGKFQTFIQLSKFLGHFSFDELLNKRQVFPA